jgi:hypothetical protein
MSTRFRCIAPVPSIANWRPTSGIWRGPAFSLGRGEAYCSSQFRSMSEPPISTAKPRENTLRDRRDAGMDVVAAGGAFGFADLARGAQIVTDAQTFRAGRPPLGPELSRG